MALRHEAEFKNDQHEIFYLEFYDSEYTGSDPISDLIISGAGFQLDWDGKSENMHDPIMPSACTIPIISDDANSEAFVDAIFGGTEGQFRVAIYKGPEGARKLFWSGVLFCDLTIKDEMPSAVNLEATDDLGLLSEILYKQTESAEYSDTTHLIDVFCRILSKCRHLDAWGSTQNFLLVSDSVQHADMSGPPYTRKIIINHQKLRNDDGAGTSAKPQFHTCRAVLVNMLQNLGARLFQADGFFWIVPMTQMATGGIDAYSYYKDGSNGNLTDRPSYVGAYGGSTNRLAVANELPSSSFQKLSGWEFGQLPPLRSVKYAHNYNGSAFDWYGLGPSNGTNISDGWSFANGSPVLESGDVVSLTLAYHFSFLGWGAAGGDRGRRIKFSFKYRHGGNQYASRAADPMQDSASNVVVQAYGTSGNVVDCFVPSYSNPSYSAASGNRVEFFTGVFDRYVGADLQGSFTITFPTLPNDATTGTEVGFWQWEILDEDGNADGTAPISLPVNGLTDIYQMRGAATYDGDVIQYERINDDENARENLELIPAILADRVGNSNPSQNVWLINDAGTYTQATGDWSNAVHSAVSTTIADLICLDIISSRFDPVETCTGDLEGPATISPLMRLQNLGETAGYFIAMRLKYSSNAAQFTGEFAALAFSTDDNSSSNDDGSTPFSLSGMSTAGPRTARQTLQGIAQAVAFESTRIQQESEAQVEQVAANSADVAALTSSVTANQSSISTNASNINTESTRLGNLEKKIEGENLNLLGVFSDIADDTAAGLKIDSQNLARIRGGDATQVTLEQNSPGTITMSVAAGASDTETTALVISGQANGNVLSNAHNEWRFTGAAVNFSNGSGTIGFSGSTSGISYNDLDDLPSGGGGGGLGTDDQTLTAAREVDLDGNALTITDGSTTKMIISTAGGLEVFGNFHVDSGTVAGGAIRLEEADLLGDNYIQIQAPLSVTANVTLTLPDGAGSSGQVMQSNGAGTLTWVNQVQEINPLVKNVLTITRTIAGQIPRIYLKGEDDLGGVFLKVPDDTTDTTLTLPNTTGTAGQVLQTDGAGVMTWETPSSGASLLPLANISGRWMWSSADDGERVMCGSTAYGPFNFYSHQNEPNATTIRTYSSSHVIGTTTGLMPAYYVVAFGVFIPTTDKKVKIDYAFRLQNVPNGSTWGLSMWGVPTPTPGANTNQTFTLRAVSADVTGSTSSTAQYCGSFTTTAAINGGYILPMMENRTGALASTAYMYGQIQISLID